MSLIERSPRTAVVASAVSSDPRQAAATARSLGFGGLLFDAYAPNLPIPDLSQTGRREFRHVLSSQEMQLTGLRADLGAKGFAPGADLDRLIHRIDRAMEAAAGLGSPLLCVDLGPIAEPAISHSPRPTITPEQAGLLILPTTSAVAVEAPPAPPSAENLALESSVNAALVELGVRADRYSVVVAFSSTLSSFAALEHAIASARCPWFGVDLDPVAMLGDQWNSDEIFSRLGTLIRHVRARDAIRGADRRTKPATIGAGSVEWPALMGQLDSSGYRGWISIDPTELSDRISGSRAGMEVLRPLVH